MRLLVLGGSGFLGAAAARRLRELGCEVATFHRSEDADVRGDRKDLPAFRDSFARLSPDIVLDTIAYTERDAAALVATFRGLARRLVVLSSQDVYAPYGRLLGLEKGAPDPAPAAEDAPLRRSRFPYRARARDPEDVAYHYEKILVEQAAAGDPELPATVLRLPCVYGPGDGHHRVGQVLARMRTGVPFVLDRTKAAWRWTRGYVENVADAIALAATDARAAGRTYNIGDERALTEAEWAREIGRAAGWEAEVRAVAREELPAGLAEPYDFAHDLVADTGRIRRELGYGERVGQEEALRASVDWERAHPFENTSLG
jgi:nucleoside-diphosphate-sugar epimerase